MANGVGAPEYCVSAACAPGPPAAPRSPALVTDAGAGTARRLRRGWRGPTRGLSSWLGTRPPRVQAITGAPRVARVSGVGARSARLRWHRRLARAVEHPRIRRVGRRLHGGGRGRRARSCHRAFIRWWGGDHVGARSSEPCTPAGVGQLRRRRGLGWRRPSVVGPAAVALGRRVREGSVATHERGATVVDDARGLRAQPPTQPAGNVDRRCAGQRGRPARRAGRTARATATGHRRIRRQRRHHSAVGVRRVVRRPRRGRPSAAWQPFVAARGSRRRSTK